MSEPYVFPGEDHADAPPTDPATLMDQIARDCRALDAVGKMLGKKLKELADAEISYGDAYDAGLVEADGSSKEKREAQARQSIDPELRGKVARLGREIEALKKWAEIKGKTLSGRQSQLSTLRDEARASNGPQPQWSNTRLEREVLNA